MSVPFLVLLGGTRRHPKQWAYISCGTCVRNRINLSRGNYKEPYIKQPEYEPTGLAESRIAEKREKKREGRGDKRGQRDKRDRNGAIGKDRGGWKRMRERRASPPSSFRFAGVSAATSHLSLLSLSRSRDLVKHPETYRLFPLFRSLR